MNSPRKKTAAFPMGTDIPMGSENGVFSKANGLKEQSPHGHSNSNSRHVHITPSNQDGYIQHRSTKRMAFESTTSEVETITGHDFHRQDQMEMGLSRSPVDQIQHCLRNAPITMVCFVIFFVFTGAGIAIGMTMRDTREEDILEQVKALADETGQFLSEQLDKAVVPLYAMAKFATHLDAFRDLPQQVADLPFTKDAPNYRNVSGVCNNPDLLESFIEIASDAKVHAGMDTVLVNLQLAPHGILCLLHPWNNTEDFEEGKHLDSNSVWGMDLLNHLVFGEVARKGMMGDEVLLSGPRKLAQCPECDPFFIARLPIVDNNHNIEIDGHLYPRWGFATALIAWTNLVERISLYDIYEANNFEFQLTRTDYLEDPDTGEQTEEVVVLAQSPDFESGRERYGYYYTMIDSIDGDWKMTVSYDQGDIVRSIAVVVTACILISFFIGGLVYVVLSQRQIHSTMLAEHMAQESQVNTERNMTAYFAHELRNPLSALDSALRSMTDEDLPKSTKEMLDGMQLCSSFMSSIMNNLLDARKLEEGKMKVRSKPLSLATLTDCCHKMMKPSVRPGVEFRVEKDLPIGQKWVLADQHRIQQVLTNVLTNAIKYTLEGSITLSVSWEDDFVQFECIDTGPGIPLSEQEHMFERFVQRGGAPGTGLGLNIAKRIVHMMGGSIAFESDPTIKPGTTCRILLPLELCEQPDKAPAEPKMEMAIKEEIRVLIVDDIKMNRMMLERRIKKAIAPNATITMASTGEQALELCEEIEFDVVICDQYMEEAGGVLVGTDTIIAMRRNNVAAYIIGCSGNDLDDIFYDSGADSVWGKPLPNNGEIIRQWRRGLVGRLLRDVDVDA